jgi:hypothetical protein
VAYKKEQVQLWHQTMPYVLQYGKHCQVGLSRMNLPVSLLIKLENEEYLNKAMAVLLATTTQTAVQLLTPFLDLITEGPNSRNLKSNLGNLYSYCHQL